MTRRSIFVPIVSPAETTFISNSKKYHQTLSKKTQFVLSIWIFTDFVFLFYIPDLDKNTETYIRVLTSYRNKEGKRVIWVHSSTEHSLRSTIGDSDKAAVPIHCCF